MSEIDDVSAKLTLDGSSFTSTMDNLLAQVKEFGIAVGIAFGVKEVISWGEQVVNAASQAQQAQVILGNTLKSIGVNYDDVSESLDNYYKHLQEVSGFQQEQLESSTTRLIQITQDYSSSLKLVAIATDVARGTGKDLETVSVALGRAFDGQVAALRRVIPGIDAHASATEALRMIQARFFGDAAAYMQTYAGQTAKLSNDVHELAIKFGNDLLPYAAKLVSFFDGLVHLTSDLLDKWDHLSDSTKGLVVGIAALTAAAFAFGPVMAGLNAILGVAITAFESVVAPLMLWTAAIVGAGATIVWFGENFTHLKSIVIEITDDILAQFMSWGISIDKTLAKVFSGTRFGDAFKKDAQEGINSLNELNDASVKAARDGGKGWVSYGDIAKQAYDKLSASAKKFYDSFKQQSKDVKIGLEDNTAAADQFGQTLNKIAVSFAEDFGKSFSSAFQVFENGTFDIVKAFNHAIDQMVQKILDSMILNLIGLIFPGAIGGNAFGILGNILGSKPTVPSAQGNVFSGGNIVPFANGGLIPGPISFPMSGGQTGIAGEKGTEGIFPLTRTPSGDLGVKADGAGHQYINVMLDSKVLFQAIHKGSRQGQLVIHPNAIRTQAAY